MCLNQSDSMNKRGFMPFPLFKKIIDESKGFVHRVNLHHRGEPLLHEDLPKMIKYCQDNRVFTQIHTNATLLTEDKSYEMIKAGLNFISFSIDGHDKKSYERVRIGARYEDTIENIRQFLKIRKQLKKKTPYTAIEVIDFFQNDWLKVKTMRKEINHIKPDKLIIKKAHNWAGEYHLDPMEKPSEINPNSKLLCTFPWYALTIFWDGTVVTCPQDFFGENKVGDLNKETLKTLWNNKAQLNYREKIKKKKYDEINSCRSCDRPRRRHFFSIPTSHLGAFLKEHF